jgi:hypothetical protein
VLRVSRIEAERLIVQIVPFKIDGYIFVDVILNFDIYLEVVIEPSVD